jgi:hypothetical protein
LGDLIEGGGTSWMDARGSKGDDADVGERIERVIWEKRVFVLTRKSRLNMRDPKEDLRFSNQYLKVN